MCKSHLFNNMATDDYESIVQLHPELVLVSEQPVTWQGFLKVSINSGRNIRIKLKLVVNNYPSFCDAEIRFGKEIAFIRNKEFSEKVKKLMNNVTKVSTFFRQLQLLISYFIKNSHIIEDNTYEAVDDHIVQMIKELKEVFNTPSEVQVSSDNKFNIIKLSLNNMAVKLQRTKYGTCPWIVVQSDLPEIPTLGPFEKNIPTLAIARNKLKLQVEMLKEVWSTLKQIDENCWIIDPLEPKPCHLYRRIYLTPSLSMFIKIDVINPMNLPEIKFMGSDAEAESKRELVLKNISNWDSRCDFIDNLMMLLDINAFPKKIKEEPIEDHSAIVADLECCICYSMTLEDETLPDKICSNKKCRKHFHTSCLLKWLQEIPGNHVVFGHIHGSCPNCQESISCSISTV